MTGRRTTQEETARLHEIWDKHAADDDRLLDVMDRRLFTGGREWLAQRAHGRVLEVAIGTGRNLPFYEEGIDLTGIDLSSETLRFARERAQRHNIDVRLIEGDGQDLPFEDETFDTVIAGLCMCNFPDPLAAVGEMKRVLKPGGSVVSLDHVRSPLLPVRLVERAFNSLSVRFMGDHLVREPLEYYAHHGLKILELERSRWGIVERVHALKPED